MFRKAISYILLAVLMTISARAQYSINMVSDTLIINTADHTSGIIYDNGGPSEHYSNSFDGVLILQSAPGVAITIEGSYHTEHHYDKLSIYDGYGSGSTALFYDISGTGTIPPTTAYSGYMTITFHTDGSVSYPGFEFSFFSCTNTACTNKPYNLSIDSITPHSAHLSWSANTPGNTFVVVVNDSSYFTTDTMIDLTGLNSSTSYLVEVYDIEDSAERCCHTLEQFRSECALAVNFPYDDLTASNVTCYYGDFANPYRYTGVIDLGSNDNRSRHTIHNDISETDPRTDNQLKCVPDGYCSSVRLGNWNTGAEGEAIEYTFTIDTNERDLLLLKYAAVMEDPSHSTNEQPRFEFGIFDNMGNTINSCYNATFVSSSSLGWNEGVSSNILWKDWTTVGVDLVPLHGQTITVRLTTVDCDPGAHYGYAYFVLDLSNKNMTSESCSSVENTYHAPAGFNYQWYRLGQEDDILSTSDSLYVSTGGFYQCRLSFIGAPNDAEHADCYFTMNVYAGQRYPTAAFMPVVVDTISSCSERQIRMFNASFVAIDSARTQRIANRCESYLWNFGDGSTSTEISPTHTFSPGLHKVTLYAMLADGECTDSLTMVVNAGEYCHSYDTTYAVICDNDSVVFYDSTYRTTGVYDHSDTSSSQIINIHTLVLTVNPTIINTVEESVAQNQIPHTFRDMVFHSDADTTLFWPAERPGCDTIMHYSLTVWRNIHDTIRHYICESELPFSDGGYTFYHDSTATQAYGGSHGEDSTITYIVKVIPNTDTTIYDTIIDYQLPWYVLDTVFNDSVDDYVYVTTNEAGCDSTIHYHLHIFWNGDHCDTNLTYPNVVTPNGDGKNDRFVIGGLIENNCFKYNELIIYNRWGREVYRVQNINNESQWWDPNDKRCPAGTYYFMFRAHGVNIRTMHKGVIEVLNAK